MPGSLQQLGKSRADLWQFAGLVALERSLERANRACDLDYWGRQQVNNEDYKLVCTLYEHIQVTLLEGREACEIKLKSPLKFWSGRSDCVSSDENGRGFMAAKEEVQPRMMGDARQDIL